MKEYEVVRLSTYGDEEDDLTLRKNNIKYPEIIQYIPDEVETFIVDVETKTFVPARDFFYHVDPEILKFQVTG